MSKNQSYPELREHSERIARDVCKAINAACATKSVMPYKSQFILEHVIELLQAKV